MDVSSLLDSLNDKQREAVAAPPCNMLILAGAGSGKTRVLVHRIAWLIEVEGVSPHSILAVTFTNKAAAEMRRRLESMLQFSVGSMWVGTFHSLAHRLLRIHYREAGLLPGFQILDADDQLRLIKRIQKSLNLDEAKWPPKQAQWFINSQKEQGLRAKNVRPDHSQFSETMTEVYRIYEENCQTSGLVDFAELLLRSYELWLQRPDILQHYQQRFTHILVDEFQDTNKIQYAWLKLLAGPQNYLMIVGDDDQSIYSWRGAQVANIQHFSHDFVKPLTIRLEQNYRSTANILAAANAVIAHNEQRLGKNLWTEGKAGETISIYAAFNDIDEARFIVNCIQNYLQTGHARKEIAILYRSNAQSRVLEEALIQAAIPYRIYGGLKFFERAEIKDALGYLRLLTNPHDDTAFERVVNTPPRGIGHQTLAHLREEAHQAEISLWQCMKSLLKQQSLPPRATQALNNFMHIIETLTAEATTLNLGDIIEAVIQQTGLIEFYQKEKTEKGLSRVDNLEELINAAKGFKLEENDQNLTPLEGFLAHAALEAGESQSGEFSDSVQMMTLHSAKGLEFPLVFLCGMEEGLFPHQMSLKEPEGLEEERRLCYVGMTRAMTKLYLTYAESRRLHGAESYHRPSRFLQEIPENLVQLVRMSTQVSRPQMSQIANQQAAGDTGFSLGQRVKHAKFGEGVVINYEGSGPHARIQVKFKSEGTKWLIASYANLEIA